MRKKKLWSDKVKKTNSTCEFCFLKSLLINIMILYNISIHTWISFWQFSAVYLFVLLSVRLSGSMSGYIWDELHLSEGFYYAIGSTVSGNDSKSCINLYFFLSCSIFKMMALVWNMASIPSESVKRSLSSSVLFSRLCLPLFFLQSPSL